MKVQFLSRSLLVVACYCLLPIILPAQGELMFEHINVTSGLSQSNVNHIMQDRQGFLWICTQDGLNRYDGYTFKIYRNTPGDRNSLSSNFVWKSLEDGAGNIWVATFGGGLCKLDRQSDQFTCYETDPLNPTRSLAHSGVRALCESPKGSLWIATDYGLSILDIATDSMISYRPDQQGTYASPGKNFFTFDPVSDDLMLIGGSAGLWIFNRKLERFTDLRISKAMGYAEGSVQVAMLLPAQQGGYWIGTGAGLVYANLSADFTTLTTAIHYSQNSDTPSNRPINIQGLYEDRTNTLWIASNHGLYALDVQQIPVAATATFQHYLFDPNRGNSLAHNQTYWLTGDGADNLWVGTREGLDKFTIRSPLFKQFLYNSSGPGLCNTSVLGISESPDGSLWIGTNEGLSRILNWNSPDREFFCYRKQAGQPNSLSSDYVMNIYRDKRDQMWLCTRWGGFGRIVREDPNRFEMKRYLNRKDSTLGPNSNVIYTILEDREGIYWLGTSAGGMNRFDPETGHFRYYPHDPADSTTLPHPYVFCLLEDSQDNFWIGTAGGGLCRMDRKTGELNCDFFDDDQPGSLSSDMILCLFEAENQQLWVGTSNGLCLRQEDGSFRRFFTQDGLPNNVIYGIQEDAKGDLWISTNYGLCRARFEGDSLITRNFDLRDGLGSMEFSQFSYHQSEDGTLFFGGVGGVTYFHPDSIRPQQNLPQVHITRFKLFNEDVPVRSAEVSGNKFALEAEITQTEHIQLTYNQNFLSFEFAGIEYSNPEKNQYAYKLEGLDRDWVYSGTRRFADYPSLPSGEYVFQVKASNGDGVWNETPTRLAISVAAPPWRTWWAYLLYAAAFVGVIYAIIRYRTQAVRRELKTKARIEQAKVAERERVRARSSRDFHDEAGNHLTKISLYAGLGKRKSEEDPELHEFLEKIEENTKALSSGMRDFIWVLDPRHDSLEATLTRIRDFGNSLFEHSGIEFVYEETLNPHTPIHLDLNSKRHLLLIFKEAMNNALKYAQPKSVRLEVRQLETQLQIRLKDDGKGFDPEQLKRVNGLNNMRSRAEEIGGRLKVDTRVGDGTEVMFEK